MNKAVLAVAVLALLCTAVYANPLSAISDAAKKVTDTVDKTVNGTKTAVNSVTNSTKAVGEGVKGGVDNVKKAGEAIANIGKKSAAGFSAPTVGVFAAAGLGSLLLLAL